MNADRALRDPHDDGLNDHAREQIEASLAAHAGRPGPLLQVLHEVQDRLGYVPAAAVPVIAEALNVSRAEVHGVVTFYHHFRQSPAGRHVIQLCQAEACRAMHCEQLTQHAQRKLGIGLHETTADGRYTLEPVYCLGNCACSPAMMIDGRLYGRVTPESFDDLIAPLS
ncbi:formate dehydrogenase subunit gamma [Steroidobacter sp. S1-65]|uniref:NADH-quinone oxidoreductase subunit E n=1 Tax=Steroidobacter gossypii TaxID=2805490 RepID=A0ABS1X1T8_9GAMM|nr:formate dehydrogenase subunit gamma [Steroidobacter gossypii]MBM0107159.1 formate dehydrogenase subunit gamma [Steroidobacter gossypii]